MTISVEPQLREQGLDIRGLTQIFLGLAVACFQYALPAIAGQSSVNDLNRIGPVFAKACRWQLNSIVPSAADVDNADKKLCHSALNPPIAYTICFHPKKKVMVHVYTSKDMVKYYPWQKPIVIRTTSSSGVYIAMICISVIMSTYLY